MSDLERQLQRYVTDVVDEVDPVRAEEILQTRPTTSRGPRPVRRLALPIAAAVVAVAVVVAVVAAGDWLRDRGGVTITAADESPVPWSQVATWGPPSSIIEGGGYLWVAMHGRTAGPDLPPNGPGGIVRIHPDSLETVAWAEVESLSAFAYADGVLWVAGFATDIVTKIDAGTGEVLATIDLPVPPSFDDVDGEFIPTHMAATPEAAWVTTARGAIARIDAESNDVVLHELTPAAPGRTIADEAGAWVAQGNVGVTSVSHDGEVTTYPLAVDNRALVVEDIALVDGRLWVVGAVLAQDGRYSDDDSGALIALEPTDGTVTALAPLPAPAHNIRATSGHVIVWSSDRQTAWAIATDATGEIHTEERVLPVSAAADLLEHDGAIWSVNYDEHSVARHDGRGTETIKLRSTSDTQ